MYKVIRQLLKEIWLQWLRLCTKKTLNNLHIVKVRNVVLRGKKMTLNLTPSKGWVDTKYLQGYNLELTQINIKKRFI